MSSKVNCFDQGVVEQVRYWLTEQNGDIQMAALLEVARMRILEAVEPIFSLRFAHSESTRNVILARLRSPSVSAALAMYEINSDQFANAVKCQVNKLGTTRRDDFWRTCGVGRPKREVQCAIQSHAAGGDSD